MDEKRNILFIYRDSNGDKKFAFIESEDYEKAVRIFVAMKKTKDIIRTRQWDRSEMRFYPQDEERNLEDKFDLTTEDEKSLLSRILKTINL